MTVGPLEALSAPLDGAIITAASYTTPVVDALTAILGSAAGSLDANNGNPAIVRTHKDGLLSYTNAPGNSLYPGAQPLSAWSSSSALAQTVPTGQMAVVSHLFLGNTNTAYGATLFTVANTAGTFNICHGSIEVLTGANLATFPLAFPLVLDQGWTLTAPQNAAFYGYTVLRDALITPLVAAVTNSQGYTVPSGKTLWLYGCTSTGPHSSATSVAQLLVGTAGSGVPVCQAGTFYNGASLYCNDGVYGSAITGPAPIPFSAGTQFTSNQTYGVTIWGVLV